MENTLFAYRTGLAGGDPRLLAYLAEQTGGAVFRWWARPRSSRPRWPIAIGPGG